MSAYDEAVLAWADALRSGRTTRWDAFWPTAPEAEASTGPLPGATQLELVRRLAERWEGPGFERLADRVMFREGPGRGMARTMPLLHPAAPAGPGAPPVDPSAVPVAELVRLGVGVLADIALSQPAQKQRPRRRHGPARVGAPLSATHLDVGRLGRRDVVVVAPSLQESLTEVWMQRALDGTGRPWPVFVRRWAGRDELPLDANPARLAARAAGRVGAARVHVFVGEAARTRPPLDPIGAELLRRVNPLLDLRVPPQETPIARDAAVRLLSGGPPGTLRAPRACEAWLRGRAERIAEGVAAGGYSVHGDLDEFVAGVSAPRRPRESAVLDRLVEVVVRTVQEEQG